MPLKRIIINFLIANFSNVCTSCTCLAEFKGYLLYLVTYPIQEIHSLDFFRMKLILFKVLSIDLELGYTVIPMSAALLKKSFSSIPSCRLTSPTSAKHFLLITYFILRNRKSTKELKNRLNKEHGSRSLYL